MTLIPDLERQLADAATRRGRAGRRRALRSGAAALAVAAAAAVLLLAPALDGGGGGQERGPAAPGSDPSGGSVVPEPAVPEPPGGADPELEDLLGVFRREATPRDSTGTTVEELEASGDRQPGEDPTRSRRIDLPIGPVYLWRASCASWAWRSAPSTAAARTAGACWR
jgi:hypothetical protein